MQLALIGCGYVGLVTGACLCSAGHEVWCVDIDETKISQLNHGELYLYEPGLPELIEQGRQRGALHFTTDLNTALLRGCEVLFICVDTPMSADGRADLSQVTAVASHIGSLMQRHLYIVDKSTVPVGTAGRLRRFIQAELDRRKQDLSFDLISNPEFLREGSGVTDYLHPDRVVIGVDNEASLQVMTKIYKTLELAEDRLVVTDLASAEMIKYASNAFLATKISFINEIANLCELVGADVNLVARGVGADQRIGSACLHPGCGFGGSCFPKDLKALIKTAQSFNYQPVLLEAVWQVNERQQLVLVEKVKALFGEDLTGITLGVWGLSFKPNTNDMRAATSLRVIQELTALGASILVYDPQAMETARGCYFKNNSKVQYAQDMYDCLTGASALVILTEWDEFLKPDFKIVKQRLKHQIIVDGRNLFDPAILKKQGFIYSQIGVYTDLTLAEG